METLAEQYAKIGIKYTYIPRETLPNGVTTGPGEMLEPLGPDKRREIYASSIITGEAVYFTLDGERVD